VTNLRAENSRKKKRAAIYAFRALGQMPPELIVELEPEVAEGEKKRTRLRKRPFPKFCFDRILAALSWFYGQRNRRVLRRDTRPSGRIRALRLVSPLAHGGVAKVAVQTTLCMPTDEVETCLFVFGRKQQTPAALRKRPDIPVVKRRFRFTTFQYNWVIFSQMRELADKIRKFETDVVHLHEPTFVVPVAIAAGMAGGVPLVVHLHSLYTGRREGVSATQTRLEQRALRSARLIACTETIRRHTQEWLGETDFPIHIVPDGADDVPSWPPNPALEEDLIKAAGDRLIIAKLARIIPLKRIDDFLAACRALLDEGYPIFCLLVSYGVEQDAVEMRRKFDEMFRPEEGEFLYAVEAPQHLLPRVAIGVSASNLEGLGLNVLEFQVAGVPVVCSNIPAHREMVTDGENGLLFETENACDLTRQLRQLLDDESLRRRLAERGRETAGRYEWKCSARETVRYYREILRGMK